MPLGQCEALNSNLKEPLAGLVGGEDSISAICRREAKTSEVSSICRENDQLKQVAGRNLFMLFTDYMPIQLLALSTS
jgi:hypothetical protein